MLPILMYNNMEGGSNSLSEHSNSSFGHVFDDSVILSSVRNRKKVSESSSCPVCSCTIRAGELESHLSLEVDRLQKLSSGSTKRKISVNSSTSNSNQAIPGSSTNIEVHDDQEIDVTGCPGADVYQRVHINRLRRLRTRRRSTPPPPQQGECPVCNNTFPTSKLQRHALRCLKRTGAQIDDDVPDSSSEDGSIDVENDEPSGGSFGAEYQWCGQWRVRATALQPAEARDATCIRRVSNDQALVVDGDEDTELYGPPQYSPSRIAADMEVTVEWENTAGEQNRTEADEPTRIEAESVSSIRENGEEVTHKPNGLVEASAETRIQALKARIKELERKQNCASETRIQALKARIKELERKQNCASEAKCLICLGAYTSPAVSIQCWHVYCEVCWLESLRAKKICPQCNMITTTSHLRRIYM